MIRSYDYDDLDNWSSSAKFSLAGFLLACKKTVWWRVSRSGFGFHVRTENNVFLNNSQDRRREGFRPIKGGFTFKPKHTTWLRLDRSIIEFIKFLFVDMSNKQFPLGGIKIDENPKIVLS